MVRKDWIRTPEAALEFVNERGFIFLWPITNINLPSLWTSVAGNRPVADAHDDPGHITWGWKDNSLDKRIWYYAKVLRRKATFISLDVVPNFYALSNNYGSPEEDHIIAYQDGHLPLEAKLVYDALLEKGPLNTIDLRKEARLQNAKESVFGRALDMLQQDFKILPVGIAEAGAWHYAYRYDLTSHHFPNLPKFARVIAEGIARETILERYFFSVGASRIRDMVKLFGWSEELIERTVRRMVEKRTILETHHPQLPGEWLSLPELTQ